MSAHDVFRRSLDAVWAHEWESLTVVLDGVDEAEADWQAPAYASRAQEAGWPPEGSIRWHVAHLAHCKRYYAAVLRAHEEPAAPTVAPRTPLETWTAECEALHAAHAEQCAALAALPPETDWEAGACGGTPLGTFVAANIRHDAWHGGQIAMLRRLYAAEGSA